MSDPQPVSRRRFKTRNGCLRCKQRRQRIKCDETLPACNQCTRKRFECPGYKRPLKWSSKYEVGKSDNISTVAKPSEQVRQTTDPIHSLRPNLVESTVSDSTTRFLSVQKDVQPPQNETAAAGPDPVLISAANSSPSSDIWAPLTLVGTDCGDPWTSTILAQRTLSTPRHDDTALLRHYFSSVCPVNSCFDSHKNFFRVEVGSLISSRPLIHYCVLSMSAAHLTARQRDMATITLQHRTNALSCLKSRIAKGFMTHQTTNGSPLDDVAEILLGSILLGMTEGWHDPTQLGITHLRGARTLFQKWITTVSECCPRTRTIITGIMSYWEAVASFVHNQSLDSISYLVPFSLETRHIYVNPWTGICTPLFIHLTQVGILTRQRSLARQLSASFWGHVGPNMLEQARATENALCSYSILSADQIEDTVDSRTPIDHLQRVARIYQLVGLLQLYMAFPELHGDHSVDISLEHSIMSMATNVLTTIGVLPPTSGVYCLLTIPLIIAGSALQLPCFSLEVPTSTLQQDAYLFWRNFVRERIKTVQEIVGLVAIGRAQTILDKVWFLADIRRAAEEPGQEWEYIQWTEVMSFEKLESIFG